jgi:hypothetical protein
LAALAFTVDYEGGSKMHEVINNGRIELARRVAVGIEVALIWNPGGDETVVCVCDRHEGAYFEISIASHLALDAFYHPFAYRDFSSVDYQDDRLAA